MITVSFIAFSKVRGGAAKAASRFYLIIKDCFETNFFVAEDGKASLYNMFFFLKRVISYIFVFSFLSPIPALAYRFSEIFLVFSIFLFPYICFVFKSSSIGFFFISFYFLLIFTMLSYVLITMVFYNV